jgi:DNA-binding XRE family transcriptional regulator
MDATWELPARILRLRVERGWTMAELAQALGVSTASISNWESGAHVPRARVREMIRAMEEDHEEKNRNWVVITEGSYKSQPLFRCERCGTEKMVVLPIKTDSFVLQGRRFIKEHEKCALKGEV